MKTKVITALVASGSGTDAYSIMSAYNSGQIPNIDLRMLVSTKSGAGCLDKAKECGIPSLVLDRKELKSYGFNHEFVHTLVNEKIEMVFLVGCVVKIPIIPRVIFYNIHPANIETCGGKGMYGLDPHKKVLTDISDLIRRERKTVGDKFFTQPTIHRVTDKYDEGDYFMKVNIEIPSEIIVNFMRDQDLEKAASQLQKHVLQYEWMMLPPAVKMIAAKMLENEKANL